MKFRYKVVIINIILLSLGIGTVGFFMIRRNFQLALDAQIKTSIEENNLLQSTIEYRLLDTINSSPSNLVYQMKNLSADVVGKMGGNNKGVYVSTMVRRLCILRQTTINFPARRSCGVPQ